MAFTVEDGTIVANANAYITVAEAEAFHADRDSSRWVGNDAIKEAAIVRATDYFEQVYGHRVAGCIEDDDQVLTFPRSLLYDRDGRLVEGIPDKLKSGISELAAEALAAPLYNEVETNDQGLRIKRKYEKVGPLEEEMVYESQIAPSRLKRFPAAEKWFKEYLTSSGRARAIRA